MHGEFDIEDAEVLAYGIVVNYWGLLTIFLQFTIHLSRVSLSALYKESKYYPLCHCEVWQYYSFCLIFNQHVQVTWPKLGRKAIYDQRKKTETCNLCQHFKHQIPCLHKAQKTSLYFSTLSFIISQAASFSKA